MTSKSFHGVCVALYATGFASACDADCNDVNYIDYINCADGKVPKKIVFQGSNAPPSGATWGAPSVNNWQTTRYIEYASGEQIHYAPRNQSQPRFGGPFHALNYTPDSGNGQTQWTAFTIRLKGVTSRSERLLDHAFVLGRLKTGLPWNGSFDARGVSMWPALPGETSDYHHIRNERFYFDTITSTSASYIEPMFINLYLSDSAAYRVIIHVNQVGSLVWMYNLSDLTLRGFTRNWHTPAYGETNGRGIGFGFTCMDNSMVDKFCEYKNPGASTNTPFSIEFDDIASGWF